MKVSGLSDKANRFEGANSDLRIFSESGIRIRIFELDGHLRIMIEVGEGATNLDIREAAPLALQWRDRLLDWQGPWTNGGAGYLLEYLTMRHEGGKSYSRLASYINQRTATYLESGDIERARELLLAMRMRPEDVDAQVDFGLARLKEGYPPFEFEDEYPVDRDKMISTLKYWKLKRKK